MKHIWVVESSGGRKWKPSGRFTPCANFTKKLANEHASVCRLQSPGLKWRVAKYERVK